MILSGALCGLTGFLIVGGRDQAISTGTAGGGMVTATVTGTSTLKSIEIKPDVVDPDDIDMLQDLVVAAVNEALKAASDKSQSQMSAITGGIGGGLGGLL